MQNYFKKFILFFLMLVIALFIPLHSIAEAASVTIVSSVSSGSYYYIRNANSGHYLDAESSNNFNVIQYRFTGESNQIWKIVRNSSGYYTLENQYYYYLNQGRKMLSVSTVNNNSDLYYSDSSLTTQQWSIIQQPDGTFIIKNRWGESSNQVLEVQDASIQYPHNVQRYTYSSSKLCQKWCLEEISAHNYNTIYANNLKIYQTEKTYLYNSDNSLAEDLKHGDKSQSVLLTINHINANDMQRTISQRRNNWENLCRATSTNPLQNVVLDMVDHFMLGTGYEYSSSVLTSSIYNHSETQTYINSVVNEIKSLLSIYSGDIYNLQYIVCERESNPLVVRMRNNSIYQPSYDNVSDLINGLTICVDGLWGNEIIVKNYTCDGMSYSGVLTFNLYDHFGLDIADVEKYGALNGFTDWYILQHYDNYNHSYKPFLTMMSFDIPFSGTI